MATAIFSRVKKDWGSSFVSHLPPIYAEKKNGYSSTSILPKLRLSFMASIKNLPLSSTARSLIFHGFQQLMQKWLFS